MSQPRDPIAQAGAKIALLWSGLCLGVAFLATPAKFLAPSLSLPAALDVGRQTFAVCNRVELALCAALVVLGLLTPRRGRWALAFAAPAALVVVQALWLIPALDARVGLVLAGQTPPPSPLHLVYIVIEASKTLWLLLLGLMAWPWRQPRAAERLLPSNGKIVSLHGLR